MNAIEASTPATVEASRRADKKSHSREMQRSGKNVGAKPDLFREGVVKTIFRGRFPDSKLVPSNRAFPSRVAFYRVSLFFEFATSRL